MAVIRIAERRSGTVGLVWQTRRRSDAGVARNRNLLSRRRAGGSAPLHALHHLDASFHVKQHSTCACHLKPFKTSHRRITLFVTSRASLAATLHFARFPVTRTSPPRVAEGGPSIE